MAGTKKSLKLLINPKTNRVLFAEADNNCVDFLFDLMSLPIATVIRVLKKQGMVGCLANIYDSIEDLNEKYVKPGKRKAAYLKPIAAPNDTPRKKYSSSDGNTVSSSDTDVEESIETLFNKPGEGGFVKEVTVFMVTDDLEIKPMSAISSLALLKKHGVKDVSALKEKEVHIGTKEALMLLKRSLHSKRVLTEVFNLK